MDLLEKVHFDVIHCAMYSPRSGTLSAEKYVDDVDDETKKRRWIEVENLQSRISAEINSKLIGHILPVLVEGKKNDTWYGRTTSNKLVFIQSNTELLGRIVWAEIIRSTAWSSQALAIS
jgi:tRNA-2-methylthio-N6-dimethylallyladenosine synthase